MRPLFALALMLALSSQSGCALSSLGLARANGPARHATIPDKISISAGSRGEGTYTEIGTGVVLHDVDVETGPDSDREQDIREVKEMAKELAADYGGDAIIDFELSNVGAIFTVIKY